MIPLLKRAGELYAGVLQNDTFGLLVIWALLKAGLAEFFPVHIVWGFLGAGFIVVLVMGDRRGVLQFCLHWMGCAYLAPITRAAFEQNSGLGLVWLCTAIFTTVGASILVAILFAPRRAKGSLQGRVIQCNPRELE